VRFISLFLLSLVPALALASPPHSGARPEMPIEWNNALPEQRQALDNFYQSLQQLPQNLPDNGVDERMRHLEQLRDMSSEQRQEMFRNFVREGDDRRFR